VIFLQAVLVRLVDAGIVGIARYGHAEAPLTEGRYVFLYLAQSGAPGLILGLFRGTVNGPGWAFRLPLAFIDLGRVLIRLVIAHVFLLSTFRVQCMGLTT
jgi:hypothetical protein